jgi:hypothetical protein
LTFKKLEDFNPLNVLRRVPSLSKAFDSRTRLSNLVAKLDGNVELQKKFIESYNELDAPAKLALNNYYMAMYPAPGTPSVTDAETTPGAQTTSGLVIIPSEIGPQATHFKITDITAGCKLYMNDGKTEIHNDSFITVDDGAAGLKFKPVNDTTPVGNFTVQASTNNNTNNPGLIGDPVIATITFKREQSGNNQRPAPAITGKPTVTPATIKTTKNTQTAALKITLDPADATVTHFRITGITGGNLFKADGTTEIKEGENNFIPVADGADGVKFTPTTGSTANGSFTVTASIKADATGLLPDNTATVTITVQ